LGLSRRRDPRLEDDHVVEPAAIDLIAPEAHPPAGVSAAGRAAALETMTPIASSPIVSAVRGADMR